MIRYGDRHSANGETAHVRATGRDVQGTLNDMRVDRNSRMFGISDYSFQVSYMDYANKTIVTTLKANVELFSKHTLDDDKFTRLPIEVIYNGQREILSELPDSADDTYCGYVLGLVALALARRSFKAYRE